MVIVNITWHSRNLHSSSRASCSGPWCHSRFLGGSLSLLPDVRLPVVFIGLKVQRGFKFALYSAKRLNRTSTFDPPWCHHGPK